MSHEIFRSEGDISAVSNELEFFLINTDADSVINRNNQELELTHEVNRVDTIELMVSMAPSVEVLNTLIGVHIGELVNLAQQTGGTVYAGSSLLRDVSNREPTWYRTTSLSKKLAGGFLDIASQQLVIGIAREGAIDNSGENFGMNLYNFLRQLSPVILSLSASSPYKYEGEHLKDTGFESRRPAQYQEMSVMLPKSMMSTPVLSNLEEYYSHLNIVSTDVKQELESGNLDCNSGELYKNRNGKAYAPFELLEPHQIYSWVRIRPDHANEDAIFSLEMRVSDISNNIETIKTINTFVIGLCYHASRWGFTELNEAVVSLDLHDKEISSVLLEVSKNGLDTRLRNDRFNNQLRNIIPNLVKLSTRGLNYRNVDPAPMQIQISKILNTGNDARMIRRFANAESPTAAELERFLTSQLHDSLINHGLVDKKDMYED